MQATQGDEVSNQEKRCGDGRLEFLVALSDALRPLADPIAIQITAMRVLGQHLGVAHAQYYEANAEGELVAASAGHSIGPPSAKGRFRLEELDAQTVESYRAGRATVSGACAGGFTGVIMTEASARTVDRQRGRALGWAAAACRQACG